MGFTCEFDDNQRTVPSYPYSRGAPKAANIFTVPDDDDDGDDDDDDESEEEMIWDDRPVPETARRCSTEAGRGPSPELGCGPIRPIAAPLVPVEVPGENGDINVMHDQGRFATSFVRGSSVESECAPKTYFYGQRDHEPVASDGKDDVESHTGTSETNLKEHAVFDSPELSPPGTPDKLTSEHDPPFVEAPSCTASNKESEQSEKESSEAVSGLKMPCGDMGQERGLDHDKSSLQGNYESLISSPSLKRADQPFRPFPEPQLLLPTPLEPTVKYTVADDSFEAHALRACNLPRAPYPDGPFMLDSKPQPLPKRDGMLPLKRKAADMELDSSSVDSECAMDGKSDSQDTQPLILFEDAVSSDQLADLASVERSGDADGGKRPSKRSKTSHAAEGQGEKRAKRSRKTHGSRVRSMASHAATALVGAVVGGIGTVALLASLPPEFFN